MTDILVRLKARFPEKTWDDAFAIRDGLLQAADDSAALGDDATCVVLLREAEEQQKTIGTWSTGSGEGLESMARLHEIMLRRATVHERLASRGVDARGHTAEAQELRHTVANYPNNRFRRE